MTDTALATTDQGVFQAMDRLDDEQIIAELKGAVLQEYVYEFQSGGKTVRGLSKSGTDDAARHMARQGEVLRELDVMIEYQDADAAYFKATVARFSVHNDGSEVKLDQVIGQKRQSKMAYGKPNEFWYEQGGQKALRNAKQKLIPENIKQQLIQSYIAGGKVRRVEAARDGAEATGPAPKPPRPPSGPAATEPPPPTRQDLIADYQKAARAADQRGIEVKKPKSDISDDALVKLTKSLNDAIAVFEANDAKLEQAAHAAATEPI